jgi:hypothetical protein
MKFCSNCGNSVDENYKFCSKCGAPIEDTKEDLEFKSLKEMQEYLNGLENEDEKLDNTKIDKEVKENRKSLRSIRKEKKIGIIVAITIVASLAIGIMFKENISYSYYISKGDKESTPSIKAEYYIDALNIKQDDVLIGKIREALKNDSEFEDKMAKLGLILDKNELNKLYVNIYIDKARQNFDKLNYETCLNLLRKAENYGYDISQFENYSELNVALEEDDESDSDVNYEVVYIPYNQINYDGFLIPDSSQRYLSRNELSQYTYDTLGFIRNEIFARHGYIFKTKAYQDYFLKQSWYIPNSNFKGDFSQLNDVEKYNIELIKELEGK